MSRKGRPGDLSTRMAAEQLERIYFKYHGLCQLCWRFCIYKEASRDHVIRLHDGGTSEDDNVVLVHRVCNEGKEFVTRGINATLRRQKNGFHIVAQRRNSVSTFAPFSNIEDKS